MCSSFSSLTHDAQQFLQVKFKSEVEKRGGDFKDTVYNFGEEEGECWALCRWLRARKYDYNEVVTMITEATALRADAKTSDFYPDPKAALGCDANVYFAQFPQLYTGFAKNGAPLFISKAGVLNVDAVECITTLDGILKFHWYIMMHDFGDRLRAQKKENDKFKRFECVIVLDLAHLTTTQLGSRALAIIKEQSKIDSLCFPETMSKMVIVNAPVFFAASWRLIKGWLDPRTTSKIDVISSRTSWEKKLKEFIDDDQLPEDYGGSGPNTTETLDSTAPGDMKRLRTVVMYLRYVYIIQHMTWSLSIRPLTFLYLLVATRPQPLRSWKVRRWMSTFGLDRWVVPRFPFMTKRRFCLPGWRAWNVNTWV